METRLFNEPRETLHAPHLLDVEVAQVLAVTRRLVKSTNSAAARRLPISLTFLFAGTRMISF